MKRYFVILALLCALPALDERAADAESRRAPTLSQSFLRAVMYANEEQIASGTAFRTTDGIYSAHHVFKGHSRPAMLPQPDGSLVVAVARVRLIDYRGRTYTVRYASQQERRDIVKVVIEGTLPSDIPPLPIAGPPERRSAVTAVGFYSLGFKHAKVSRSQGWYEGMTEVTHPEGSRYPYAGPILRASAPVASGMSGGALLDGRGRVFGVLVFVGRAPSTQPWAYSGAFQIR